MSPSTVLDWFDAGRAPLTSAHRRLSGRPCGFAGRRWRRGSTAMSAAQRPDGGGRRQSLPSRRAGASVSALPVLTRRGEEAECLTTTVALRAGSPTLVLSPGATWIQAVQRGQVHKLAGGSWAYRYRDEHGQRRQHGGYATKGEASERSPRARRRPARTARRRTTRLDRAGARRPVPRPAPGRAGDDRTTARHARQGRPPRSAT